jgi:hypothetical protein
MPFKTNQVEYNKFNKTKGYFNNPYEIDARELLFILQYA